MIGTSLAHYRITGELGAGGMGEVWKAEDTKLGREVALKVLPEEFVDDPQRLERFEREARAVAALNHPHIVTIFSVEEAEGVRFLTMELIEGECLDKLIPKAGLDVDRFFAVATPLAEAISAAHDKSVIHRDLKPSNVMVDDDGRVKVLDFGLAKLQGGGEASDASELPTEALTGVGMVVGTVPYMSPEQIEGKHVDHRSDVFSLGVLLYEMATGGRPFQGDSQPALMSSILKDVPTPLMEIRADLPRHLGRIIGRCLEKNRRDRYQTARDIFNELKALQRESSSGAEAAVPPRVESSDRKGTQAASMSGTSRQDEGFWIAVLPFKYTGDDADLHALAEGLSEDIVTGLSRFSYLRVISRSSTSLFADSSVDVRAVGEELGARYVMEGTLRQAGKKLRVAVQLVDTESGAHLWAETYDRVFDPDELFALQDDVVPRVVSTCADHFGVLARAISEAVRSKSLEEITPYEALMRGFGYHFRLNVVEHAQARDALERAVEEAPSNADCWAMLAWVYAHEHAHGFNPRPESLDRALEAAKKAVDLAPANHLAQQVLAVALFFRKDAASCRNAVERALALNPLDGSNEAIFIWDRGCDLVRRAMELNPHHPNWYGVMFAIDEYRKENYAGAVDEAVKSNAFDLFWTNWLLAAAYGQMGEAEAARKAIGDLLAQKEDFARTGRELMEKWFELELVEHFVDGLGKAGLDLDSPDGEPPEKPGPSTSAAVDDQGIVGIAVLPFADMSPAKDQDYFCEGMAEEIMNALVQVDGIRVPSRTSAFKAVEQGGDLKSIGRTLSVGQVLEGSVRVAGDRLRVTAQLTDVESGYQMWSERYDREAEDVFAIQDEIAAGVVEAVTSKLDSGDHTIQARAQVKDVEAYRHYLKGRHYRYSKNDHANALKEYEKALALDPTHGPSWVGQAEVTILAAVYSLIPSPEGYAAAKDGLATARRLQGESAEGCYVEGMIAFCEARWSDSLPLR
jgi:TolB-like protein